MPTLVRLVAVLLSLSVFPLSVEAQSAARTVTLSEVLRRARENAGPILVALQTLRRVQAQEQYARGAYIPRLSIEGGTGYSATDQPYLPSNLHKYKDMTREEIAALPPEEQAQALSAYGLPSRTQATSLTSFGRATFDYPVLDLGRHYAVRSAHMTTVAQRSTLAASQRTAARAGATLYMQSAAAASLVEDARISLERRNTQLQAIHGLVKAGIRPSVDATRAQIELVQARYALESREIELAAAGAALATGMGSDPLQPFAAAPFDDAALPEPLPPLEASVLAIERRPEVKQQEATLEARRADHRSAIGARLPTAGLLGQGNVSHVTLFSGNGLDGASLSAQGSIYVRWSALDPAVWRRANVTRSSIDEAQQNLEALLLAVRGEVVDAAYQVQRTRALLAQAGEVLAAAQATRTAQNERYRAGVASLLELLDAEGLEQNARRQQIEAARDHRIARTDLLALCGTLEELAR